MPVFFTKLLMALIWMCISKCDSHKRKREGRGGKREKHHKGDIKGICFRYHMNHGSGNSALAYRQGVGLLLCAFPIAGISKHSG